MSKENEVRGYFHKNDMPFEDSSESAFERAFEKAAEQGALGYTDLPISLAAFSFASIEGYLHELERYKKLPHAREDVLILEALRPHVCAENLPITLAYSGNRRVDAVLEAEGFIALEKRV